MNFAEFIFYEEIEEVFAEVDLLLEAGIDAASQSLRNRRLQKAMYINPNTGMNWRAPSRWKQLESIIQYETKVNNTDPNKIWINFSDTSKFGQRLYINPSKTTPVGIFAFPALYALKRKDGLAFQERPYMHVFKTKKAHFEVGGNKVDKNFSTVAKSVDPQLRKVELYNKLDNARQQFNNKINDLLPPDASHHLLQYLSNWGSDVTFKIKSHFRGLAAWSDENIQLEKELASWFDNVENALPTSDTSSNEYMNILKNSTFDHFDNTSNQWTKAPRFIDIQSDGSARINPDYLNYLRDEWSYRKRDGNEYVFDVNVSGRLSVDDIIELSSKIPLHGLVQSALQFKYNPVLTSDKGLRGLMLDYLKDVIALAKETIQKEPKKPEELPYGQKLKKFATENGLDFNGAISNIFTSPIRPVNNANQFLYRMVEQLALQMASSDKFGKIDYRSAWSKILRALGVTSVADTKETGHVHSSELTQGVFLDPKDIVHITTIIQTSGSDYNDPANRPQEKDWRYRSHSRIISPANQKTKSLVNYYYDSPGLYDMDSLDRTYGGLLYRVKRINKEIQYLGPFTLQTGEIYDPLVTSLIKLSKSYNQLMRQDFQPSSKHKGSFVQTLGTALSNLHRVIQTSPEIDPGFLKKVELLKSIHDTILQNDKSMIKTPILKKSELQFNPNPKFGKV